MDVNGFDLRAPASGAKPRGHRVRGAPLGVGSGEATLKRAELVDRFETRVAVRLSLSL
jgi:hypothetical protein